MALDEFKFGAEGKVTLPCGETTGAWGVAYTTAHYLESIAEGRPTGYQATHVRMDGGRVGDHARFDDCGTCQRIVEIGELLVKFKCGDRLPDTHEQLARDLQDSL